MHPAIQVCLRYDARWCSTAPSGMPRQRSVRPRRRRPAVPVTTTTPFCVYSAAKAITTTVVHMLVERGQISLDARVCDYLPTYTGHGKERTTVRHVMTHSAGVPFPNGPRADQADERQRLRPRATGSPQADPPTGLMHIYHG